MKINKVFITLGLALATAFGVGAGLRAGNNVKPVKAATKTTVYYAVSSSVVGSYSVKLNVNYKGNGDDWHQFNMNKLHGVQYDSNDIYACTYTDAYDGVGVMQFQLYDGVTWKSQDVAISSWTGVATYNNKVHVHNTDGWASISLPSGSAVSNVTLKVTFATAVPDFGIVYLPGEFNSWALNSTTKMTPNAGRTEFTYTLASVNTGIYEYAVVVDYIENEANPKWTKKPTGDDNKILYIGDASASGTTTIETELAHDLSADLIPTTSKIVLTFGEKVANNINVYVVGTMNGWADTAANLSKGLMVANAERTVFTWNVPENTRIGTFQYKVVGVDSNDTTLAAQWANAHVAYADGGNNASVTFNTEEKTESINATDNLSLLGAITFSTRFNSAMAPKCTDEDADNSTGVSSIWTTWKDNFEALPSGAKTQFGSSNNDDVLQARSLYLHCVSRYKLTAWTDAPSSSASALMVVNNSNNNTSISIILISSLVLLSAGGFFFIRKRKEDR